VARAETEGQKAARAGKPTASVALIVPSVAVFGHRPSAPPTPVLAGHGVHPLFFMARPRAEAPFGEKAAAGSGK